MLVQEIAYQLTRSLRAVIGASMENAMKRRCVIGILLAALTLIGSAQLSAQNPFWPLVLIPNGETVYDVVNDVTWLTDANLPARQTFGIPLCDGSGPYGSP